MRVDFLMCVSRLGREAKCIWRAEGSGFCRYAYWIGGGKIRYIVCNWAGFVLSGEFGVLGFVMFE